MDIKRSLLLFRDIPLDMTSMENPFVTVTSESLKQTWSRMYSVNDAHALQIKTCLETVCKDFSYGGAIRLSLLGSDKNVSLSLAVSIKTILGLCSVVHNPTFRVVLTGNDERYFSAEEKDDGVAQEFEFSAADLLGRSTEGSVVLQNPVRDLYCYGSGIWHYSATGIFKAAMLVDWWDPPFKSILQRQPQVVVNNLYLAEESKDLTILCSNNTSVKCHRLMFAGGAESLKAMVETSQMKESKLGEPVDFSMFSQEEVTVFVEYLYGIPIQKEKITLSIAANVFQMAHLYQFDQLLHEMNDFISTMDEDFFADADECLRLFYLIDNVKVEFEDLHQHLLDVLSRMKKDTITACSKYQSLSLPEQTELIWTLYENLRSKKK